MALPILPLWLIYLLAGLVGGAGAYALAGFFEKGKKTLLIGPQGSGKTTFLRHIAEPNQKIPEGPSGLPRDYRTKNDHIFNVVTDLGGADAWLENSLDLYMKDKDFVLLFFDVNACLSDDSYQGIVSARLEFIHKHKTDSQKVLLVGSHIDEALSSDSSDYESKIHQLFADKSYRILLKNIVYIDATNKNCVDKIVKGLKNA